MSVNGVQSDRKEYRATRTKAFVENNKDPENSVNIIHRFTFQAQASTPNMHRANILEGKQRCSTHTPAAPYQFTICHAKNEQSH